MTQAKYIVGNSTELIKHYDKIRLSPSLIITSPPYFDVLNYENNKDQIGFGQDYDKYLNDLNQILQDCYTISTDSASLWLVVDTFKKKKEVQLLPFDIVNKLKSKNPKTWVLKEVIIWDKEKNLPWVGNGNFRNQFEYVLFFTKGDDFTFNIDEVREINDLKKWWKRYPERYNPKGKAPSNIWSYITPIRGWNDKTEEHLCPFPYNLVEKIITISSNHGEVIFDPFAGSGTVLAIAQQMGRVSWGIDINKKYQKIFREYSVPDARKYWERQLELFDKNSDTLAYFQQTNQKLRILKTISTLLTYFNTKKERNHLLIAIDISNKSNNKVRLHIYPKLNKKDIIILDEKINSFLNQAKVEYEIIDITQKDLKQQLTNITLYKYRHDRFYSYNSTGKIDNVIQRDGSDGFFFTDICVKIH